MDCFVTYNINILNQFFNESEIKHGLYKNKIINLIFDTVFVSKIWQRIQITSSVFDDLRTVYHF